MAGWRTRRRSKVIVLPGRRACRRSIVMASIAWRWSRRRGILVLTARWRTRRRCVLIPVMGMTWWWSWGRTVLLIVT